MSAESFAGWGTLAILRDVAQNLYGRGFVGTVDVGTDADAAHTSDSRIVFIPTDNYGGSEAPRQQPAEGHAVATSVDEYTVSLYAGDFGALERLWDSTRAALDEVLSPNAFQVTPSKAKPRGGELGSAGWGMAPTVVIRRPVFAEKWIPGHVDTATQHVGVVEALDADPADVPETIS